MTRTPTDRLVGVPEGTRLRVLRIMQAGDRVADVDSDIASARRACAQLGLTPSRVKTVHGMSSSWGEFSVCAETEADAMATAAILSLVDVWGVPL